MTQSPVCIRCGDHYSFTRKYKGNYCPDCHEAWSATPRSEDSPRPRPRSAHRSSTHWPDDEETPRPEPPYDEA